MERALDMVRRACQEAARRQARALDQEVLIWLRCGYTLEEIHLVHRRQGLTWTTEILPGSMGAAHQSSPPPM